MGKNRLGERNIEKMQNFVFGLDEIDMIVDFLKQQFGKCKIFAFYGPLGAGKTTLIRQLLKSCGVREPITCPTFTYLNCYKNNVECKNSGNSQNSQGEKNSKESKNGQKSLENKVLKFYHFDLYRLKNLEEFLSAGFDEYLDDKEGISFVEWPEVIEPIMYAGVCKVKIDYNSDAKKDRLMLKLLISSFIITL